MKINYKPFKNKIWSSCDRSYNMIS